MTFDDFAKNVQINTTNSAIAYAKKCVEQDLPLEVFIVLMERVVVDLKNELAGVSDELREV